MCNMIYIGELELLGEKEYEILRNTKESDEAVIFTKKNAVVPVSRIADFNCIRTLKLVETEESDEKAFYIGEKYATHTLEDITLLTDVNVCDKIKDIFKPQVKKEKRPGMKRKGVRKKVSEIKENIADSNKNPELNGKQTDTSNTDAAQKNREKNDDSLENSKSEGNDKTQVKRTSYKKIQKPDTDVGKAEKAITETKQDGMVNETTAVSAENNEKLKYFIKQMSVRAEDMVDYKGTTEDLAKKIAMTLNTADETLDLLAVLQNAFSENDAKVVYKWIHANIKKLVELAKDV